MDVIFVQVVEHLDMFRPYRVGILCRKIAEFQEGFGCNIGLSVNLALMSAMILFSDAYRGARPAKELQREFRYL